MQTALHFVESKSSKRPSSIETLTATLARAQFTDFIQVKTMASDVALAVTPREDDRIRLTYFR